MNYFFLSCCCLADLRAFCLFMLLCSSTGLSCAKCTFAEKGVIQLEEQIHTGLKTHTHTHIHACMHVHTRSLSLSYTHTQGYMLSPPPTPHAHAHHNTLQHEYTHTHACKQAHTHVCIFTFVWVLMRKIQDRSWIQLPLLLGSATAGTKNSATWYIVCVCVCVCSCCRVLWCVCVHVLGGGGGEHVSLRVLWFTSSFVCICIVET